MEPYHPFFREKAMREYLQRQEKDILPRFLSPYTIILFYVLVVLLVFIGLLAWWGETPFFMNGAGIVRADGSAAARSQKMVIVLFLPAKYASQIHLGAEAQVSIEPAGQQFTSTITQVEAKSISPQAARQRYKLNDVTAQAVPQSSVMAILLPIPIHAPHVEAGDLVSARVHVGEQRILSFLLGLHEADGG